LNWKFLCLALGTVSLLFGAGCSGINASKSISPATFLLPGLMRAEPPPASPDRATPLAEPENQIVRS
jgi:hypothetical protein